VRAEVGPELVGDGKRYVAFTRSDGVPAILDARRRKVTAIEGARGCSPVAIGGRRVLLDCSTRFEEFRPAMLAPVSGGAAYPVRGSRADVELDGVGRYWLRGYPVCSGACDGRIYVNRRTGDRRTFSSGDGIFERHPLLSFTDLDLGRERLRLRPHPRFVPPVRASSVLDFSRRLYVVDEDGLRIWWSRNRHTRIGQSIGAGFGNRRGLSLGSGQITWVRKGTLHAFDLDERRLRMRKLERGSKVVPIKGGVVAAVPNPTAGAAKLYRIAIWRW
jgi:hypothetical protein